MPSFRSPTSCHLQQSWIGLLAYHLLLLLLLVVNVEGLYGFDMRDQGGQHRVLIKIGNEESVVPEKYRGIKAKTGRLTGLLQKPEIKFYTPPEKENTSLLVLRQDAETFNYRHLPMMLEKFVEESRRRKSEQVETRKSDVFPVSSTVWLFDDRDLNEAGVTAFLLGMHLLESGRRHTNKEKWHLRNPLFERTYTKLSDKGFLFFIEDNAAQLGGVGNKSSGTEFIAASSARIVDSRARMDKKEGIEKMNLAAFASRGSVFSLNWDHCEKVNDFLQTANIIIETDHGDIVVGFEKMLREHVKGRNKEELERNWWFDKLMYITSEQWNLAFIRPRGELERFGHVNSKEIMGRELTLKFIDTDLEEFLQKRRIQKIALVSSWSRYGPVRIEAEGVTYEAAVILEKFVLKSTLKELTLMVFKAQSIPADYHLAAELITNLFKSWRPEEMGKQYTLLSFDDQLYEQQFLNLLLGIEAYELKNKRNPRTNWKLRNDDPKKGEGGKRSFGEAKMNLENVLSVLYNVFVVDVRSQATNISLTFKDGSTESKPIKDVELAGGRAFYFNGEQCKVLMDSVDNGMFFISAGTDEAAITKETSLKSLLEPLFPGYVTTGELKWGVSPGRIVAVTLD
eukprot:GHVS01038889.1.p1 GENE.GHVS01038889.1~~GHVS01038889.1.p1  ORF type:complete len:624 (+),score=53.04 GHVS01038889.1:114-1985(+)